MTATRGIFVRVPEECELRADKDGGALCQQSKSYLDESYRERRVRSSRQSVLAGSISPRLRTRVSFIDAGMRWFLSSAWLGFGVG